MPGGDRVLPAVLTMAERNLLSVVEVYGGSVRFVQAQQGRWRLQNGSDTFQRDTFRSLGRHGLITTGNDHTNGDLVKITPAGQHWMDMFPNVRATPQRRDLLLAARAGRLTAHCGADGSVYSVSWYDPAGLTGSLEVLHPVMVLAAVLLVDLPPESGPVAITARGEWAIDLWREVGR